MDKEILVTGGTGFIGSHTTVALLEAGYDVTILDNLSNSHEIVIDRIAQITGNRPRFIQGDLRDKDLLQQVFSKNTFEAVIHFAALKSVGESVVKPLEYYNNNIEGTLVLLNTMQAARCKSLVFSSSATVYGAPATVPIFEDFPRSATNPYGRSKIIIEDILQDLQRADPDWKIACLRYFNPVGAHPSGLIGEDPCGVPNNLMPFIAQVASGLRERLSVYGNDYETPDGTGVRDYIHVMDLAEGHVAALDYLSTKVESLTVNLGTGRGVSVFEMIKAFEAASGQRIPFSIEKRRPGDIAACWADTTKANALLKWSAKRSLHEMCTDSWRWQSHNPQGYSA